MIIDFFCGIYKKSTLDLVPTQTLSSKAIYLNFSFKHIIIGWFPINTQLPAFKFTFKIKRKVVLPVWNPLDLWASIRHYSNQHFSWDTMLMRTCFLYLITKVIQRLVQIRPAKTLTNARIRNRKAACLPTVEAQRC